MAFSASPTSSNTTLPSEMMVLRSTSAFPSRGIRTSRKGDRPKGASTGPTLDATDCPGGHHGQWLDKRTGKPATVDPADLEPEQRKHYEWDGAEVIYTFWAKHGPCLPPIW